MFNIHNGRKTIYIDEIKRPNYFLKSLFSTKYNNELKVQLISLPAIGSAPGERINIKGAQQWESW